MRGLVKKCRWQCTKREREERGLVKWKKSERGLGEREEEGVTGEWTRIEGKGNGKGCNLMKIVKGGLR